jgi:peptide chain release factor 2
MPLNEETEERLDDVSKRLDHMNDYLNIEDKEEAKDLLEKKMEEDDFWNDPTEAQKTINECNEIKEWTEAYRSLQQRYHDVKELLPEAIDHEEELTADLMKELGAIEKDLGALEIRRMLSGELDNKSCYLSINAGAGGTEACDWVSMLSRMYQRWSTKRSWKCETIDSVGGEVAGMKSITMKIAGPFAYGYAKAEKGVHRLVRISPFDSNSKRHTSFASVDVTPEITDDIVIDIKTDDLRVDTFRASGAGGQHVNVTDSAVRITHAPSGIIVSCQGERSQFQNKETCMKLLKSKLYEKEIMERENSLKALSGEKKEIAWGSQIRNYVFQPYTLVKDTRTKYEAGNIQAVMDGDIDAFVNAYLKGFG